MTIEKAIAALMRANIAAIDSATPGAPVTISQEAAFALLKTLHAASQPPEKRVRRTPEQKAVLRAHWTPERREALRQIQLAKWTPEARAIQAEKLRAYQARLKAAPTTPATPPATPDQPTL